MRFNLPSHYIQGGEIPNPSAADLLSMLREFAESNEFTDEHDVAVEDEALRLAAASYLQDADFVRAWFVSDGRNFAQVTYTCAGSVERDEVRDCERMIRTLQFGEA